MPRILVPTDFSEASQSLIYHVLAYTDGLTWDILLLHVVEEEFDVLSSWIDAWAAVFGGPFAWENMHGELCDEAALKRTVSLPFSRADQVKTIVAVGKAADQILKVAQDHQADLIVMGASRRSLVSRLLFGSVSAQVVRKAPIPVIMVSGISRASLYRPRHTEIDL